MTSRWCLTNSTDKDIVSGLERCLAKARACQAMVIAHVAEIDRRRLFRERGFPSMHAYCVEALHMSEAAAFNRIAVGRLALRYPRVLDMIATGHLHLSGAKLLGPILDDDNVDRLLDAAARQSKRRIAELVAAEAPRPDVRTELIDLGRGNGAVLLFPEPVINRTWPRAPPARIEALAPKRYALQVTISSHLHDKLRQAQDLLRHSIPDGDIAQILERGLDLVIERATKRQFAATDKPRPKPEQPADLAATVPAHLRREVAERDGYRCTFVADDGTRCGATSWLQFDHVEPRARGGPSTADNLRLLCRAHNQLEAERRLGRWVGEIAAKRERVRSNEPPSFADAWSGLVNLGFREREARGALDAIRGTVSQESAVEEVLRAALRELTPERRRRSRQPGAGCRESGPIWRVRRANDAPFTLPARPNLRPRPPPARAIARRP